MATKADSPGTPSRLVSGRYPSPGTDTVADRIRARRGARGLTPLDANLLHFPAMAGGYNDLLGALRTGGKLPGDVRELMILRIAALNKAAFEWIQHEKIGRAEGLTTGQLYVIRDTVTPLPPMPGVLSPLQSIALEFTDSVTRELNFTIELGQRYKEELRRSGASDAEAEDLYVEASMVVAGYNMVSRFLVATDVNGLTGKEVPWPLERHEHNIQVPSYKPESSTHSIHTIALKQSPATEWLVFANSLLTNWQMWSWVVPYFLDGGFNYDSAGNDIRANTRRPYNLILHSQRGHGTSGLPAKPSDEDSRQTTIPLLSQDIHHLLTYPEIRAIIDSDGVSADLLKPIHSIIGVSQGGAAALAFAGTNNGNTKSVIACDTSAKTPGGNKAAWAERVRLVYGNGGVSDSKGQDYAASVGMKALSDVTVPRWFPSGSPLSSEREAFMKDMVSKTDVQGFVAGAEALGDFDLISGPHPLYESQVEHVLLLAGSLDGGGKVGQGLKKLKEEWVLKGATQGRPSPIEYTEIQGSGHLPMVDQPERFCEEVGKWLSGF
ncbi:hypothetical protein H1R20_g16534, partial [Candolleomyces eurysporus]